MNQNKQISKEAQEEFDKAKAYFSKFSGVDWMAPSQINIKEGALPKISEEEGDKRISDAMYRLYGKPDENKDETKND